MFELRSFKRKLKIELKQIKTNISTDFSVGCVILIQSLPIKRHTEDIQNYF